VARLNPESVDAALEDVKVRRRVENILDHLLKQIEDSIKWETPLPPAAAAVLPDLLKGLADKKQTERQNESRKRYADLMAIFETFRGQMDADAD
jgi:hypothetical protein